MQKSQTISERLLTVRNRLGLSQQKLAERLGVTRNWVNILERDPERIASNALLLRIEDLEEEMKGGAFLGGDPRQTMRAARERKGMTLKDLSRESGYSVGVLQALEEGHGRGSERQIEKIAEVLDIPVKILMQGAEPKLLHETGATGTHGAKPDVVAGPGVGSVRLVPLISFAQAGRMGSWNDAAYNYEAHIAYDVKDGKAFCVTIRGDSKHPVISEGDVILVYPSRQPRNGDLVLAKLSEDAGGDVMCKIYAAKDGGNKIILSSYNPAHALLEYPKTDFQFIYTIANVTKSFLSQR